MQVNSREDLVRLMKVLIHHRMYPSDDWNATAGQVLPGDHRARELFREYMSLAREADRKQQKGAA